MVIKRNLNKVLQQKAKMNYIYLKQCKPKYRMKKHPIQIPKIKIGIVKIINVTSQIKETKSTEKYSRRARKIA